MAQNSQQDAQIRKLLKLEANAPLNDATRVMLQHAMSPAMHEMMRRAGIQPRAFQDYCTLFAEGVQWVHAQHTHTQGPRGVYFGVPNSTIDVTFPDGVRRFEVRETPVLARAADPNEAYIIIPNNAVQEYQQGYSSQFSAHSRRKLGMLNAAETTFITAVDVAYGAVQHQDPAIRARIEAQEQQAHLQELFQPIVIGMDTPQDTTELHDREPRELDVVPVLERALEAFRKKRQKGGPA